MLESMFCPIGVAVIGVGRKEGNVGHEIFDNIREAGFQNRFFAVNPKTEEIHGEKVYPSIKDIPYPVELAVVVVPSKLVPQVMEEAGEKGVKAAVIISAGFKETGIEGARLEKQVIDIAERYGIRVLGPNCLGVADTGCGLNATFAKETPYRGEIAMMSQSGALLTAILDWAKAERIGFSKIISLGNKADISEIDLLKTLKEDNQSKVICAYIEGITRGRDFMMVAEDVSKKKPIIAIKSGGTDAGARAVSSHTGTLAGSEQAYNSAFKQSGIIRAGSVEDLFDYAVGFAYQPLPKGRNVAIMTNAGGPGIMATDACERYGVSLAAFEKETIDALREVLPPAAGLYNPVDVLGDAKAERYRKAMEIVLADENVHSMVVILTPQAMTEIDKTAKIIVEMSRTFPEKLIYACYMGRADVSSGIKILTENRVPNYYYPERAVATLATVLSYAEYIHRGRVTYERFAVKKRRVREIFDETLKLGRRNLPDIQASQVADAYGIRIARCVLAKDVNEAIRIGGGLGFPLALKVVSPDILHKSDVGGIAIGVRDEVELGVMFNRIIDNVRRFMPQATIWGICLQEMITGARETIIGMSRDPQFGPLILFGLGGIYVEVLKDVSFRIAPVPDQEARKMVTEIQSYALLRGTRGQPGVDIDAIVDTVMRVSQLAMDFPEIVEMDINPFMALEKGKGGIAADVRITIGGK
ncbi:MAG: acetate--CoA ligase family protein [Actinobacteria bacterium]|nr:acetate--CoA ligase family protein [Actinomycetota bacterium]